MCKSCGAVRGLLQLALTILVIAFAVELLGVKGYRTALLGGSPGSYSDPDTTGSLVRFRYEQRPWSPGW